MTDANQSSDSSSPQESELRLQLIAPDEEWVVAWLAECDARIAAEETGSEHAAPWTEVYARLRARLERRRGVRSP